MNKLLNIILILVLALAFLPSHSYAQSIKTSYDEKTIMVDSLNLPTNTSMLTVLNMLPELLQRPGNFLFSNYDIQVEGMSVGNARDVALTQLQIVDVEKIEVSESPISSYNNNGQGGSINIILVSSSADKKKYWGSAGMILEYPLDVAPQVNLGYKNDKFMVRGMFLGEVYNMSKESEVLYFDEGKYQKDQHTTTQNKTQSQLASAYIQYSPTDKDVLKLNLSEVFSNDKDILTTEYNADKSTEQVNRFSMLRSQLNYKHSFARSSLEAEAQYLYNPGVTRINNPSDYNTDDDYRSHNISGKIEYCIKLLSPSQMQKRNSSLEFKVGSNFNGVMRSEDNTYKYYNPENKGNYNSKDNTWYVMPYAILQGQFAKFYFKAVGEYQHIRYDMTEGDNPFDIAHNNFTGKLMTEWHFNPQKNLRLIFKRNIERPTSGQLYSSMIFNPSENGQLKGNSSLKPMMSHEVVLDYIASYKWKQHNTFMFDVGVSYNNVSDIISEVTKQPTTPQDGTLGQSMSYKTYENIGTDHILSGNLMAVYSYKAFSISLTGNVYHNDKSYDSSDNSHYTYYNLALYPHFNLKDGWSGGAKVTYYSKVDTKAQTLSDCAVTRITVGRSLKKIYAYVFQEMTLRKNAQDINATSANSASIKAYDMTPNIVGIGIKYTF